MSSILLGLLQQPRSRVQYNYLDQCMHSSLLCRYICTYCIRCRSLANVHFTPRWSPLSPSPLLSRTASTSSDTILLYENTQSQTKFFRLIYVMSGVQLVFWVYLSYFAFAELRQETLCQQANNVAITPPRSSSSGGQESTHLAVERYKYICTERSSDGHKRGRNGTPDHSLRARLCQWLLFSP